MTPVTPILVLDTRPSTALVRRRLAMEVLFGAISNLLNPALSPSPSGASVALLAHKQRHRNGLEVDPVDFSVVEYEADPVISVVRLVDCTVFDVDWVVGDVDFVVCNVDSVVCGVDSVVFDVDSVVSDVDSVVCGVKSVLDVEASDVSMVSPVGEAVVVPLLDAVVKASPRTWQVKSEKQNKQHIMLNMSGAMRKQGNDY